MTVRDNAGKRTRQRVRPRRAMQSFDSKTLPELARKVTDWANGLNAMLNEFGAGFALDIVDGTADPARLLQRRPELEFEGAGVTLSTTAKRNVVTIPGGATDHGALTGLGDNDHTQYPNDAAGYDGITSAIVGQIVTTHDSHNLFTDTFSASQNNYSGTGSASGDYDTADHITITPTALGVDLTGKLAPTATGTRTQTLTNGHASNFLRLLDENVSSSAANRFACPWNTTHTINPGGSVTLVYVNSRWLVVDSGAISDHGSLTGLTDDDHAQYILVAGTRDFTGNQSMGNNALLDARTVELNVDPPGVPSAEQIRIFGFSNGTSSPAALQVKSEASAFIDHPEMVKYETGSAAGGGFGSIAVDFSSINGRSLSDGVWKVIVKLTAKNTTASRSYPQANLEQWIHYEMDVGGTNVYSQVMEQPILESTPGSEVAIAYWNGGNVDTTTIYIKHSTTGGSTLNVEWAALLGGTDTWEWFVTVKVVGR